MWLFVSLNSNEVLCLVGLKIQPKLTEDELQETMHCDQKYCLKLWETAFL